jgi:hypothetical protein
MNQAVLFIPKLLNILLARILTVFTAVIATAILPFTFRTNAMTMNITNATVTNTTNVM